MGATPIIADVGEFALGVVLLVAGGEALVRGAVGLAARLGVAPLVIGLTVVAFGTSAPELALNLAAAVNHHTGLSFGNVVGSNIANIGLVLGLSSLLKPMRVRASLVKREIPMMLGATALFIALAHLPPAVRAGAAGFARADGVVLLAGFGLVFWVALRLARRTGAGDELARAVDRTPGEPSTRRSFGWSCAVFLFGLALLIGGGKLAELGAVGAASALGVSNDLIGLTVVALATSLPELSTSLIAARRGHVDIAVGNVVGSNLFNLLLVMGATAVVEPAPLPAHSFGSLLALGILSVALWPMSVTAGRMISRLEGAALLAMYFVFLGHTVVQAMGMRG